MKVIRLLTPIILRCRSYPALQLLLISLALSVSACSGNGHLLADRRDALPSPIQYFQWLTTASPEEIAQTRTSLESVQNLPDNNVAAIQLAMLLSVPAEANTDQLTMARNLLTRNTLESQTAATNSVELEYRRFGEIWLTFLQNNEDRRLSANENADLQNRVNSLTDKITELQQQIEALTTIEQRMIEREREQGQTQ